MLTYRENRDARQFLYRNLQNTQHGNYDDSVIVSFTYRLVLTQAR